MHQESAELLIHVGAEAYAENEDLDEISRQLCNDLTALDGVSAEMAGGGTLPEGAKGEPITVGTILIRLAEAGGITALVALLNSWLSRDSQRRLMLQIGENRLEVTGISSSEQADLIHWFQIQTGMRLEA